MGSDVCFGVADAALSCWVVIPVKPPPDRKSRLARALGPDERNDLVRRMATHVARAAAMTPGIDSVAFIASCTTGLPPEVPILADRGGGLNGALTGALADLAARGATRAIIVAGDLPLVTPDELAPLVTAGAIMIAPDRHGTGTNAISLPLPAAGGFTFAFGPDSFALHRAESDRLGIEAIELRRDGLARDVDEPGDLDDAADLLGAAN